MIKKILTGVILCGISLTCLGQQARKEVVETDKVSEIKESTTRRYTGHIKTPAQVQLTTRIAADLLSVQFKEGDHVKKGDILYCFDPIRYDAAVKAAEAAIKEVNAHLTYAETNYRRTQTLYEKKASSKDLLENTQSALAARKAALLAAEAALITAKDDLKNTVIKAPIDGKIGATNYTPGNYLTPSSGVLSTIIQMDPIRVCFFMSNKDYFQYFGGTEKGLRESAQIKIQLADDSNYEYEGVVEFVNNEVNRTTDSIQVYVLFKNPEEKLIPGSSVTVFVTQQGQKVPAVVPSAVMHDASSAFVYVVSDKNVASRREVSVGRMKSDYFTITKGLQIGETVVSDGTHKVIPGMEVIPAPRNSKK